MLNQYELSFDRDGCSFRRRVERVKTELELHDVMDRITKYLSIRDLCRAAQVCKSWREAADREKRKRTFMQKMLIPFDSRGCLNEDFNLFSGLKIKPYVSLFFFGLEKKGKLEIDDLRRSDINRKIQSYKRQLPRHLVGLEVCEFRTLENDIHGRHHDSVGLLLPLHPDSWVTVRSCVGSDQIVDREVERIIGDFLADESRMEDVGSNATMLVFAQSLRGYFVADYVVNGIRERSQYPKESVWGGFFNQLVVADAEEEYEDRADSSCLTIVRILSSNLKSYTLIVDMDEKKREIDSNLFAFSSRIPYGRKHTGLVLGPKTLTRSRACRNQYYTSTEVLEAIKNVLPLVTFTGLFVRNCTIYSGIDCIGNQVDNSMDRNNYMNIIVMSYE